ncbi:hypothetical protein [Amycolatopsis sp. Hca4]|uniref:hypothetical protein n=1 Tax=Amycolatopsis sp. Hca4 TaxID=2742131 RepID=UPI0015922C5B|nr:hypothetical protein [Amycolatopsis sp. Hca4]QKV74172.1 hypothetical protein HUT10_10650 [Amycolatopsis sp. Hca4]
MTIVVTAVPETLSAAQRDMNTRNPGPDTELVEMIEFHRYNAEMFRLAGERLREQGQTEEDDWTGWCLTLQTNAVQKYTHLLRSGTARAEQH